MLVNVTLIPFFLGIFTNVSKESDFDLEYLFEMNKLTIQYQPFTKSTELSSRITCHPFLTDCLRCFVHDITYMTSVNRSSHENNRIKVDQWIEMKYMPFTRNIQNILVSDKEPTKFIKSFMKDIIHQFNIGRIADVEYVENLNNGYKKDNYMGQEKTPIGKCITEYITELGTYWKDAYGETESIYQISLLDLQFDQKDIHIRIDKRRADCLYSSSFADFIGRGKMTSYHHITEVIDNRLRIYALLNGERSISSGNTTYNFSQVMDLRLINITSRKTISFKDYNLTVFDY